MPVIPSLFGGSRSGDDMISFSSFNPRDALNGLFPALRRRDPRKEMSPFAHPRITSEQTAEHHIYKTDLKGLRIEDVKLKVEAAGVLLVCGEQRIPKGKEQRLHGEERCLPMFRHRILLPEDAEVEQVRAAARKGVLIITMPRKGMQKPDSEAQHSRTS